MMKVTNIGNRNRAETKSEQFMRSDAAIPAQINCFRPTVPTPSEFLKNDEKYQAVSMISEILGPWV